MHALTWPEAYGRMRAVGFRTATGTIRWRLPGGEGELRFWHQAPDRWRVEDGDGVWHVADGQRQLVRADDGMADMSGAGMTFREYHPQTLFGEAHWLRDFPTPQGPGDPVELAGRRAWEFTMLPARGKPYPLRVAVDETTGTVLRMAIPEGDYVIEVLELTPDGDLPDGIFTWDGPVSTRHREERAAVERVQRWLTDTDLPLPRWWPRGLGHHGSDGDPVTGAFRVLLEVPGFPELSRWPADTPMPAGWDARLGGRHVHRWQDERWAWALAVDEPLTEEDLTRVIDSIP